MICAASSPAASNSKSSSPLTNHRFAPRRPEKYFVIPTEGPSAFLGSEWRDLSLGGLLSELLSAA